MKVEINNEYQRLNEVVLGLATTLHFPDRHEMEAEAEQPWWKRSLSRYLYPLIRGRKVPKWLVRHFEREKAALVKVLHEYGVKVHEVMPVQPEDNEPLGLGQMFVRDPLFCLGQRMVFGQLQIPMRQKERRGFLSLAALYEEEGPVCQPETATAYIEGGDVVVDLPYVYVGIGEYGSNEEGAQWLQDVLGAAVTVVRVPIRARSILHLDCCLSLIGPKLGIIHRPSLCAPLPYPLNTYEFIEVDDQTRAQMGINNVLLDEKPLWCRPVIMLYDGH